MQCSVAFSILDSGDPARPGRPAKTYLIMSRNCARIAPGGSMELEILIGASGENMATLSL